jgi:hypothetical protein
MSDNARWAFAGHGLAFAANRADPGRSTVSPNVKGARMDAYSVAADATKSGSLSAAVEVASLWASLPWLDVAPGWGEGLPRALVVGPQHYGFNATEGELRLPDALLPTAAAREKALTDRLSSYPGADRFEVVRWDMVHLDVEDRDEGIVVVRWVDDSGAPVPVRSIAVTYLSDMGMYLWPGVGTNLDVLSPLMTWWALLYGLSHLARYEPAAWTGMLDRDRSVLGVPIERGLRYVRTVMPRLVLHALTDSWQAR